MKSKLLALALGSAVAVGSAHATTVGGIYFEDTANQTYFENTTLFESVVNNAGDTLTGYGMVTSVNGNDAAVYGGGLYRLYFTFSYNVGSITSNLVQFDSGTVNVYRVNSFLNLSTNDPTTAQNFIQAGTLWATFSGHDNVATVSTGGLALNASTVLYGEGTVLGQALKFTGSGLLDVTSGLADVVNFLDTNKIPDAVGSMADAELFTDASSTGNISGTQCAADLQTGLLPTGEFCVSGSANVKGTYKIPEPGSLALVGLGLLGLVGAGRRKQ